VLEVAAGTGYWTGFIATTATTITATDVNSGPLSIALSRSYPRGNVRLQQADAFALDQLHGTYTASFVGFWWSHITHLDTDRFLRGLCTRLQPRSPVAIVDNRYVEGSSHPITHTDAGGNTYQHRTLADGSRHRVLKNFPTAAQLRTAVAPYATHIDVHELNYYWLLTLTTRTAWSAAQTAANASPLAFRIDIRPYAEPLRSMARWLGISRNPTCRSPRATD